MLNIRKASLSDAKLLANFAEITFRETYSSSNSDKEIDLHCERNFSPRIQYDELLNPNTITLLAEGVDGKMAAYAQIRKNSSIGCVNAQCPTELRRIYLSKQYHGLGLANEMLQVVFKTVAREKSDHLWLGVWEDNARAISFYKKHNFTVVGEYFFKFGNEPQRDLIMSLDIEALD